MPVVQDDLWKHPGNPGMIVVTSHASIDPDGRLYLGYGTAKEATRRIPDIEQQCGRAVLDHAVDGVYGFLPVRPSQPEKRIIGFGIFQTRIEWEDRTNPELIKYSMDCLRQYSEENQKLKIRMNFPETGSDGPAAEEVAHMLVPLPPTVTVCHNGEVQLTMPNSFPGFKTIYLQVERMLHDGYYNQAVEYLMKNGFDIQSAMNQVNAVQRLIRERVEKDTDRVKTWRQTQFPS